MQLKPLALLFKTARKQNLFSSIKNIRTECYPFNWNTWLERQDQELKHSWHLCAYDGHHVFTQRFGMQKGISTSAWARERELIMEEADPREQEKLWPVPIPAMQLDPTKWFFQEDRAGSQIPKNFRLKSVYSTKFWEDQKLGVEGLPHGHWTIWRHPALFWHFFNCLMTLHYILKWKAVFVSPKLIAFTRNIWKCAFSPHI